MKRTKTKRALQALTLVLLSALLYCCTDEQSFSGPGNGDERTVLFSVKVPGASTPRTTRALSTNDESAVKQIAVLLFDENGKYTYHPIYSSNISDGTDGKKTFTIRVPEGTFNMVILANANASLNKIIGDATEGTSKADLLKNLTVTNTGKWNTDSQKDNYMPIPMWGEIPTITVNSSTKNIETSLLRMVSKIDVSLATEAAADHLDMTSIRLYNYSTAGQIVPNAENWDAEHTIVTAPSLTGTPAKGPLVYENDEITKDKNKGVSCLNEIYTFEAAAGASDKLETNTCLIIGGTYKGDSQPTYYRVDIANTTDKGTTATYLALLRNHQYKVNIQDVKGPGANTPEQALKERPNNITASVIEWNDAKFTQFIFDGQYMLGLSQGEYTFSKEKRDASNGIDNSLSIITDHPDGWKATITDEKGTILTNSWLGCSPTEGKNVKGDDIKLTLGTNDTDDARIAYIHIRAGRLDYKIKVTQLNTVMLGIHIIVDGKEESTADFVSNLNTEKDGKLEVPAPKSIKILWDPSQENLMVSSSIIKNSFEYNKSNGLQELPSYGQLSGGNMQYKVQPIPISKADIESDAFFQRTTTYNFALSDGLKTITKTLTLHQTVYNVDPKVPPTSLMDGKPKSFGVRANTNFTVELADPSNGIVSNLQTSGAPNLTSEGTPVTFDIIDDLTNPSIYQKEVEVIIKSPNNLFPAKKIKLNCVSGIIQEESNTYLLKPDGVGLLIPVSRANKSDLGKNQIGANDVFTAELVWTDNSKGVAPASNIKVVKAAGKGDSGYVLVLPGSAQGNAVVAAKVGGNIIWSWHIWVSKEEPTAIGIFMDRSLGALGTTPGSADAVGLNYQWGRKDPLPKIFTVGDKGKSQAIYDSNGKSISFDITEPQSLKDVISHPLYHPIAKVNVTTDWCSTSNNLFWNPDKKTIYDPCPKGWRIAKTRTLNGDDGYQANWDKDGVMIQKQGGWYAASGWYESDAKIGNTPHGAACVWSSSYAPKEDRKMAYYFSVTMNGGGIGVENPMYRSTAMQVRCINQ